MEISQESKFIDVAYELGAWLREEHGSEGQAVKSGAICEIFNLHKETLRGCVNFLRSSGMPICSSTGGYWYSEKPEDIQKTLSHLEGRVKGINRAIKGLKAIQENTGEIRG